MNPQEPFALSPFVSETALPVGLVIRHSQMARMRELEGLCERHSSQGSETTKPASESLKMSWKQHESSETIRRHKIKDFRSFVSKNPFSLLMQIWGDWGYQATEIITLKCDAAEQSTHRRMLYSTCAYT